MTLNVRESENIENLKKVKSDEAVQLAITSIQNFMNPFAISDKDYLHNFASGAPVPPDIEHDKLPADKIGKSSKEFMQHRFITNSFRTELFKPNKKLKVKTMEACNSKHLLLSLQTNRLKPVSRDKQLSIPAARFFFQKRILYKLMLNSLAN